MEISNAEKSFIIDGVSQNVRNDGRGCLDYRSVHLQTGIVSQTNGSAHVKLGNTEVLVGVKVETTEPDPETPDQGKIAFSVECAPSAVPALEATVRDGSAAYLDVFTDELATRLERLLLGGRSALDLRSLSIIAGKLCWRLYVDVIVIDFDGNLFDAIVIAARAALYNTAIPKVEVDEENMEFELCDDTDGTRLDVSRLPVAVTLTRIGTGYVVDARPEEEACESAHVTVSVNRQGNFCGVHKGGPGGLEPSALAEMMHAGHKLATHILARIEVATKHEETLA
eukprot:TRINITY_DN23328_c0_g1_i1.p3 TRINITY_DN23328_c0_g1~~TRINITY_DN23328_c0_g1_i1.p3  ORF type:complete len:283 (+),score=87.97 TRINITY_DN23328_c0_g1_i1:1429-2277(+)